MLDAAILRMQDRAFDIVSKYGPAEVHLRRSVATSVETEGGNPTASQATSVGLVVRLLNTPDRIAATSLPGNETTIRNLVARLTGGQTEEAPELPHFAFPKDIPSVESGDPEVAETTSRILSRAKSLDASLFWTVRASRESRWTRTLRPGLDAEGTYHGCGVEARVRGAGQGVVFDRHWRLAAATFAAAETALFARIALEMPRRLEFTKDTHLVRALGPKVFLELTRSLLRCGTSHPPKSFSASVDVFDCPKPFYSGHDDEGSPMKVLAVANAADGFVPWKTSSLGLATDRSSGRAFRNSMDALPTLTPLGLGWAGSRSECPPTFELVPELGLLSEPQRGTLVGITSNAVLIRDGVPQCLRPPQRLALPVFEILGRGFAGASTNDFAVGRHRLPFVLFETDSQEIRS